jgi:hypothetical protein
MNFARLVRFLITDEVTSISSPCFINSKLSYEEEEEEEERNDSSPRT